MIILESNLALFSKVEQSICHNQAILLLYISRESLKHKHKETGSGMFTGTCTCNKNLIVHGEEKQ